jgi:hypothetical protein
MEDTFESLEDDDLEEEADDAVEAILFEVTKGTYAGTYVHFTFVRNIHLSIDQHRATWQGWRYLQ